MLPHHYRVTLSHPDPRIGLLGLFVGLSTEWIFRDGCRCLWALRQPNVATQRPLNRDSGIEGGTGAFRGAELFQMPHGDTIAQTLSWEAD